MSAHKTTFMLTEDMVRTRSYLIWEREGCPEGRDKIHWQMARTELEAELLEASVIGESTGIVLPLLPISRPPHMCLPKRGPVPPRRGHGHQPGHSSHT